MVRLFSSKPFLMGASLLALASCESATDSVSSALETVNPVQWFENDSETNTESEEETFPNIGEVPKRPNVAGLREEYQDLKSGLIADRDNARYTQDVFTRDNSSLLSLSSDGELIEAESASIPKAVTLSSVPKAPPQLESIENRIEQIETRNSDNLEKTAVQAVSVKPQLEPETDEKLSRTTTTDAPAAEQVVSTYGGVSEVVAVDAQIIAQIFFQAGSKQLLNEDRSVVSQVVELFNRDGASSIWVVGHASQDGADESQNLQNYKIALDRAAAVARELVGQGVDRSKVRIDSRGAAQPAFEETNAAGAAGNRRAEIFFLY